MSARVMLLFLAIGVFVAIWSGDRREGDEMPATASTPANGMLVAVPEPPLVEIVETEQSSAAPFEPFNSAIQLETTTILRNPPPMVATRKHGRGTDPARTQGFSPPLSTQEGPGFCATPEFADSLANLPLPGGITPGEYRVVRSDGRVQRIRLTAEELDRRGIPRNAAPRGHYLLHDGRVRWYFIRVEIPSFAVALPKDAVPPPVVARKPHQSGWGWSESARRMHATAMVGMQTCWEVVCKSAQATSAEFVRRGENLVDVIAEQWRQTAVRMRRVAAEPGTGRR